MLNNFLKHCSFTSTCEAALYHFCNISWFVILKHTLNPLPKITEAEPITETFSDNHNCSAHHERRTNYHTGSNDNR